MKSAIKQTTTAYSRIRKYVLTLLSKSGNESVQLPRLDEMIQMFGASRPTVCKALKIMEEEGIIIGRRSIGIFTNPDRFLRSFGGVHPPKFIGVIFDDGRHTGVTNTYSRYLASILTTSAPFNIWMRQIQCSANTEAIIRHDLELEQLDGVIAIAPSPEVVNALKTLSGKGLKVVLDRPMDPDISSVEVDYYLLGEKIADAMMSRSLNKMLFFPYQQPHVTGEVKGMCDEFARHGKRLDPRFFIKDVRNDRDQLAALVEKVMHHPEIQVLYLKLFPPRMVCEYIQEHAPALLKRLIIVCEKEDIHPTLPVSYLASTFPQNEFAKKVLAELQAQFDGDTTVRHIRLQGDSFHTEFIDRR